MKKNTVQQAFLKSVPVMAGYLVLGTGFGILMRNAGYGVLWAASMSLLIYAGSMQYVGVGLLTGGASVLTVILTTVMVNARHLFYSISMLGRYRDAGKYKPYMIFALTDETYSLLCDGEVPEGVDANLYRFLGNLLGAVLPFSTAGIEFSMTALFIVIMVEQWMSTKEHLPALLGIATTVLCLVIFGADMFIIPSMVLIASELLLFRKKLDKTDSDESGVSGGD